LFQSLFHDPLIRAVVVFTGSLAFTALATLFLAVTWSFLAHLKEERSRLVQKRWLPVLAESAAGLPVHLPTLGPMDEEPFLVLWNHFQESLVGQARSNLIDLGVRLGIERKAKRMLRARSGFTRALAIMTLGHLKDESEWETIADIVEKNESIEGYIAAQALVRIDPKRAAPVVVPLAAKRTFWPQERVAAILKNLGPENIGDLLVRAVQEAPREAWPRLIRLLHLSNREQALAFVRRLLAIEQDPEILAACLVAVRQLGDNESIQAVRSLLFHPSWQVRVQAVNALAVMATRQDLDRLVRLLSDDNWWVRYRSAQAIVWLPFLKKADVEKIRSGLNDRYGRDSLERSIAERQTRDPTWQ